jgi:two-component system sensor histidine kinase/response regulator
LSDPSNSEPNDEPRVLVVDDDATTRTHVAGLLEQRGYRVDLAADGAAGLARLVRRRPDLILLDVMLPDCDGYDLCRRLQSNPETAGVPVIFLTAKGDEPEILRGFESGGVDYVVKPYAVAVLLARVETQVTLARLSRGLHLSLDDRTRSLRRANQRLRELNLEMATLEERQRRRLAQQLHDTAIQDLILARMLLHGPDSLGDLEPKLTELIGVVIRQLRTLVFELSPPLLERGGLYPALEWLANGMREQWGLEVQCEQQGELPELPNVLAVTLFQGARELLINAAKHAEAGRARLSLRRVETELEMRVADDGRGFAPEWLTAFSADAEGPLQIDGRGADEPPGYGLNSLRSRIELLGGRLLLANTAPRGAEARLSVPLAAQSLSAAARNTT